MNSVFINYVWTLSIMGCKFFKKVKKGKIVKTTWRQCDIYLTKESTSYSLCEFYKLTNYCLRYTRNYIKIKSY